MNEQPTHIDLFSGIGGFALAAAWAGFRTVAFCEIDAYCQAVIKARFGAVMADTKCFGNDWRKRGGPEQADKAANLKQRSPVIWSDIHRFDGTRYRGAALLTGGFPCQPFSVAGKRAGAADDRYLWPEMLRVIAEARPAWVLGENVAGIVNMELDRVLSDLEAIGYSTWPLDIPACAVDARHRRARVWIVGHTNKGGIRRAGPQGHVRHTAQPGEAVANSSRTRSEKRQEQSAREEQPVIERGCDGIPNSNSEPLGRPTEPRQECCLWKPEPDVGRVANGIPSRVDRLKSLGNAIVPEVAFQILKEIRQLI